MVTPDLRIHRVEATDLTVALGKPEHLQRPDPSRESARHRIVGFDEHGQHHARGALIVCDITQSSHQRFPQHSMPMRYARPSSEPGPGPFPLRRRSATGCRSWPVGRFLDGTFLAQPAWRLARTGVTSSIRNMKSLGGLTDAGLTDLDRALRHERLRRREAWRDCENCGEAFLGRGDARFCTTRCRVAAHRARKDSNE